MAASYSLDFLFEVGNKNLKNEADSWIEKNFIFLPVEDGICFGNGIMKVRRKYKFLWWSFTSSDMGNMEGMRSQWNDHNTIAENRAQAIRKLYVIFLKHIKKMPLNECV